MGRAYARFAGLSVDTAEIARTAGRAGTSGPAPTS
ncbi:hypothetical protein ACFQ3Z_07195 [Streptomyces nogalater]